jgi:hypothetical protein
MRGKLTRRKFLQKGFLAALGARLVSCAGPQRLAEITPVEPTDTVAPPPTFTPEESPTRPTFTPTQRPTLTAEAPPTPTAEGTPIPALHEARYYLQLDDNRVHCQMCFRRCTVPEGGRGFCRNKTNTDGRYNTVVYSHPSACR